MGYYLMKAWPYIAWLARALAHMYEGDEWITPLSYYKSKLRKGASDQPLTLVPVLAPLLTVGAIILSPGKAHQVVS